MAMLHVHASGTFSYIQSELTNIYIYTWAKEDRGSAQKGSAQSSTKQKR